MQPASRLVTLLLLLFAVSLFGCTATSLSGPGASGAGFDATQALAASSQVEAFIAAHPNARVSVLYLSYESTRAALSDLSRQCGAPVPLGTYYQIIADENNARAYSLVDVNTRQPICVNYAGPSASGMPLPPSVTPPGAPTPRPTATPAPTGTVQPAPTGAPTPQPTATLYPSADYDALSFTLDTTARTIQTDMGPVTGQFITVRSALPDAFQKTDTTARTDTALILITPFLSTDARMMGLPGKGQLLPGDTFIRLPQGLLDSDPARRAYTMSVYHDGMLSDNPNAASLAYYYNGWVNAQFRVYYNADSQDVFLILPENAGSDAPYDPYRPETGMVKVGTGTHATLIKYSHASNALVDVGYQDPSNRFTNSPQPHVKLPPFYKGVSAGFTTPRGTVITGISPGSVTVQYRRVYHNTPPTSNATPLPPGTLLGGSPQYDVVSLTLDTSYRSIQTDHGTVAGKFITMQSRLPNAFMKGTPYQSNVALIQVVTAGNTGALGNVYMLPAGEARYTLAVSGDVMASYRTSAGLPYAYGDGKALVKLAFDGHNAYVFFPEFTGMDKRGTADVLTPATQGNFVFIYDGAHNQFVGADGTLSQLAGDLPVAYAQPASASPVGITAYRIPFTSPGGSKVTGQTKESISLLYNTRYVPTFGNTPTPTPVPLPAPTATPTPTPSATPAPTASPTATPTPSATASASVTYDTLTVVADTSNRSIVTQNGTATGEFLTLQSAQRNAFFGGDSSLQSDTMWILADGGSQSFPVGTVFGLPTTGSYYTKRGSITTGAGYQFVTGTTLSLTGHATGKGLQLVLAEPYGYGGLVLRFEGASNNGRNQFVTTDTGTDSTHVLFATSGANTATSQIQNVPYTSPNGLKITSVSTSVVSVQVPQSHP